MRGQAARCAACVEQGYTKAGNTRDGLDTLKWGTDYLLRTLAKTSKSGAKIPEYNIAYQVIHPFLTLSKMYDACVSGTILNNPSLVTLTMVLHL